MKIRIKPRTETISEEEESLLVEPIPEEPDYYRVHRSLVDDLIDTKDLIIEQQQGITDPEKWCEERGFFALKGLLTKINAIQQASKGKFNT